MSEIPLHLKSEPVNPPELKWWGVTVASMLFVAQDTDAEGAIDQVYLKMGIPKDTDHRTLVAWAPFDDRASKKLSDRFNSEQGATRVEPFTLVPWDKKLSPQRVALAREASGSRLSNY